MSRPARSSRVGVAIFPFMGGRASLCLLDSHLMIFFSVEGGTRNLRSYGSPDTPGLLRGGSFAVLLRRHLLRSRISAARMEFILEIILFSRSPLGLHRQIRPPMNNLSRHPWKTLGASRFEGSYHNFN